MPTGVGQSSSSSPPSPLAPRRGWSRDGAARALLKEKDPTKEESFLPSPAHPRWNKTPAVAFLFAPVLGKRNPERGWGRTRQQDPSTAPCLLVCQRLSQAGSCSELSQKQQKPADFRKKPTEVKPSPAPFLQLAHSHPSTQYRHLFTHLLPLPGQYHVGAALGGKPEPMPAPRVGAKGLSVCPSVRPPVGPRTPAERRSGAQQQPRLHCSQHLHLNCCLLPAARLGEKKK